MTQDRTGPRTRRAAALFFGLLVPLLAALPAPAQTEIANVPLFLTRSVPPLAMINLSNDNQLYFQAFPDYADLDGDGAANRTYTHSFDYYGYFDSYKCYTYSDGVFTPAGTSTSKYCSGDQWSGNFLNWVAMARIDVVRKILYGGHRSTDTATSTVLERTYLPNDAHSWVRHYDGEDIAQLTPFTLPLETTATSTTRITVPIGRRNPNNNEGSVVTITATGWNSTNDVQVGDQLIIHHTSDDNIWMVGVVTNFTANTQSVEVQVTGSNGVGQARNSWRLTNWSRRGVSFCNTIVSSTANSQSVTDPPLIRVARGNYSLWTANERWQCRWSDEQNRTGHNEMRIKGITFSNGNDLHSSGIPANSDNPVRSQVGLGSQNYIARVRVCVDGTIGTEMCKQYPNGNWKPIGLLQEYGEDGSIRFGLMTGSYQRNLGGGLLRKNISSFADEVNASDGRLDGPIVRNLNAFRIYGYNHSTGLYSGAGDDCDVGVTRAQMTASPGTGVRCRNWGNPQAEIFLESIRYFAGKNSPTSAFTFTGNEGVSGLSTSNWRDPLSNDNWCAVSSIINFNASFNSFDGDQLGGFSDLANAGSLSDWTNKVGLGEGIAGASVFHGGSNALCTAKTVGNLADVSGICPEAPNQAGTFHIAGLAHYAWTKSIRTDLERDPQKIADIHLKTYGVSLAPAVPRIEIPRPGQTNSAVTILPACVNSGDGGLRCALADFRIIEQDIAAGTGRFFIQWDVHEWGSDFDMDINGTLSYQITATHIDITTNTWSQSSSRATGFGYILSGTTQDGFHAHSGINGYNYTDPTGVLGCNNCRLDNAPTTVRYTLGGAQGNLLEDPVLLAAKWGGYNKAIDFPGTQTSWDRTGDGIPDNYFYAIDPEELFLGLRAALDDIIERGQTSASSAAASSATLETDTLVYTAGFRPEDWTGTLIGREVNPFDGKLLVDSDGKPTGKGWDAEGKLQARLPSDRKIYTVNSATEEAVVFLYTNLSELQKAALDHSPNGTEPDGLGEKRVDWLRGKEDTALFRCRRPPREDEPGKCQDTGPLRLIGDIVNSNPQFVSQRYTGASRLLGAPSTRKSENTLYIGANDGMLHAFDAATGDELFAFIPSELLETEPGQAFSPLTRLMEPGYIHRYFVDGTPEIEEAFVSGSWKTVLVGSMGAGGRTVFALDVTDPGSFSTSHVLWEFTDPDLGYNVGQPTIARLSDGTWAAIFGNGYNSLDHKAYLFVVRLSDGHLISKISTGVGSASTPNGLASPKWTHWPKSDLKANTVYAGDLLGNLWKFDLSGTIATWPAPKLLFTARDPGGAPQPITVRPAIATAPDDPDTLIVAFGTGSDFRVADGFPEPLTEGGPRPWPVQSLFGIRDTKGKDDYPLDRTKLSQQAIVDEQTVVRGGEEYDLRVIDVPDSATPPDPPLLEARGWFLDLCLATSSGACDSQKLNGERVISEAVFPSDSVRDRIRFTTLIPVDDPCRGGRTGYLYDLNLLTGGRYNEAVFDLDGDGKFDEHDKVTYEGEQVPPSGIRFGTGERLTVIQVPGTNTEYGYDGSGEKIDLKGGGGRSGRQSWQQLR